MCHCHQTVGPIIWYRPKRRESSDIVRLQLTVVTVGSASGPENGDERRPYGHRAVNYYENRTQGTLKTIKKEKYKYYGIVSLA